MTSATSIQLNSVSFSYECSPILKNVTLTIQNGEFVGIFGPNGGGKTTLLKILMGFLQPDQGSVLLWDLPPTQARSYIGYVPQISKVDRQFPITVEEVVQMGQLSSLNFFGILSKAAKERSLDALEKVSMLPYKDAAFGQLSGGQAQRVLIARALASDARLLLLDEPTASVDPHAEQEILSLLFSLKGKLTILMVTHDLQTILQKTEKLLCVHREVHPLAPSEVCEHFGLGLYHSPLIKKPLFTKTT